VVSINIFHLATLLTACKTGGPGAKSKAKAPAKQGTIFGWLE
jgi:hypothetical protein